MPGSSALDAARPDEEVTRRVSLGDFPGAAAPEVLVIVLDASNLEQHLVFAQELIELGRPVVVALNMVDLAERDGLALDPGALSQALGVPVVPTVAVRKRGLDALAEAMVEAGSRVGIDERSRPPQARQALSLPERRLAARPAC